MSGPTVDTADEPVPDTIVADPALLALEGVPYDQRPVKLEIRGLRKVFGSGAAGVTALDGIDLDVPAGGFVSLVGVSGCGKSTLLNIVAGRSLDSPIGAGLELFSSFEYYTVSRYVARPHS